MLEDFAGYHGTEVQNGAFVFKYDWDERIVDNWWRNFGEKDSGNDIEFSSQLRSFQDAETAQCDECSQ